MTVAVSGLEAVLEAMRSGQPIIIRHGNHAQVVLAAERVTTATMAFLVRHTSGFVCVALDAERMDDLHVPLMPADRPDSIAYTVSVDAKAGTTTGISAHDRALTARALADPRTASDDLARPGHVVPIRLRPGGVLAHPAVPEAAADLCRLAGLSPAAVLAAAGDENEALHELVPIEIGAVVRHRERIESPVRRDATELLATRHGEMQSIGYLADSHASGHFALVKGDISGSQPVPVRVHVECFGGDVLGSCSCAGELEASLASLAEVGRGVLVYLRSSYRHCAHPEKVLNGRSLHAGQDYRLAAHILLDLEVCNAVPLTDSREEIRGLAKYGIVINDRAPAFTTARANTYRLRS